ncbi:MAG TPA: D-alanine--D-alanine ligase, partial [Spirochaetales bacterium]|nr:D-alanine--D-alanine ligase [Spirochaetales bacterium]
MKVAILYGGKSGEHEVSLSSAAFIARNLDKAHRITLIGVSKDGQWVLQSQSTLEACLESDGPLTLRTDGPQVVIAPGKGIRVFGSHGVSDLNVDIVFPVLHGTFGEDGTVQGLLECANIAYVGADVLGSAVGMDKEAAKILWQASGLPVVPYLIARSSKTQELTKLRAEAEQRFGWPMFVKPARCGSSLGAQAVKAEADFIPAIEEAMDFATALLCADT